MPQHLEYVDKVLSAIRQFAHPVHAGRKEIPDISILVDATSQLPLANLDAWERLIRCELFRALETSTPSKWKFWTQPTAFLTWIDLCSGDGFKREKTLRTLSGAAPNSFFFALAVRRLNDWVPQVRKAARDKLSEIAKKTDPEQVVDVLCAILPNWNSWGRLEDADKQALIEITSIKTVVHSIKSRVISATSGPMTSVISQAGRTEIVDPYLYEIAKNAIQPSVRAKAYRCLLEKKMVWFAGRKWKWTDKQYCKGRFEPVLCERAITVARPFLETLKLAARDKSPMVRRVAGEMLIRELKLLGTESIKLAELLASDSSSSVAERGRFALDRIGNLS